MTLAAGPPSTFDHVVSLGGRCQLAYQIRRYFEIDAAQLFDWWVTPTSSLIQVLESGFEGLLQPENIDTNNSLGSAVCKHTGLLHFHDFPHDPVTDVIPLDTIPEMCRQNQEKYGALTGRFRTLLGRILFVRYGKGFHVGTDRNELYTPELVDRLVRAIAIHFSDFRLLLVSGDNSEPPDDFEALAGQVDPRVMLDAIDLRGEMHWHGRDQTWDELFVRHGGHEMLRSRTSELT